MTDVLDDLRWRGLIALSTDLDALRASPRGAQMLDQPVPSLAGRHDQEIHVMGLTAVAGHDRATDAPGIGPIPEAVVIAPPQQGPPVLNDSARFQLAQQDGEVVGPGR